MGLGRLVVWPGDEGTIDENSCRANYGVLKHVPAAFRIWNDIIQVPHMTWVIESIADCWQARGCMAEFCSSCTGNSACAGEG